MWRKQYPDYAERLAVMEEAVYYWLLYWDEYPDQELTLVRR